LLNINRGALAYDVVGDNHSADTERPNVKIEIMQGRLLRQVLDKMLKGNLHVGNARVQVCLPNGEYYDIASLQLLENKLLGVRETHRLVFTIKAETWNMGKVLRKID
jgi:hypothetical protein